MAVKAEAKIPGRGGRPSREAAGALEERILNAASGLFLTQGYGVTSIEAIAQRAGISKRTFYHRFNNKADIFAAVVQRLVARMRPKDESHLFTGHALPELLLTLARIILHAAISSDAISLHRLLLAESSRVPELTAILENQGARQEAIERIAGLLQEEMRKGHIHVAYPRFAAEQFLHMVISVPQRSAMGMGPPMSPGKLEEWVIRTVDLFLNGCRKD
jgi:TetR/AcrR family transcriptional repressor of mexJK operon